MKNRSSYAVLTRFGIIAAVLATLVLIAPAATAQSECAVDGSTLKCTYDENGTDPVASFTASDEDTEELTFALLEVDDHGSFTIGADSGVLSFKKAPNFEAKSSYKVTVTTSAGGAHAVEISINNVEEGGEVTFEGNVQPQVGRSLRANLKDGDGGEFNKVWQWSRSTDMETWEDIETARASLYTPGSDDVGSYLRAAVTYRDALGSETETAMGMTSFKVESTPAANRRPEFPDQDLEMAGIQNAHVVLEVNENTAKGTAVGEPVVAFDRDGDSLLYSLGDVPDSDAASPETYDGTAVADGTTTYTSAEDDGDVFTIDVTTGQIKVENKAALDFELATNEDDAYVVQVTATDPSGAPGTINVVITVEDVNEAPVIGDLTDDDGDATNGIDDGEPETNPEEISIAEESTAIDADPDTDDVQAATFTANDPDTAAADDTQSVDWSTAGPDGGKFKITTTGTAGRGVLTFDKAPSYEAKGSADGDNVYEVDVVAASDGSSSKHSVKITITNIEETGKIDRMSQLQPVTGIPIVALDHSDKDGDVRNRSWSWYRAPASDEDAIVVPSTGASPVGAGADSTLATLTDCDDDRVPPTADVDPCKVASGSASYTPVDNDAGYTLYAVVQYTDGHDDSDGDVAGDETQEYVVLASENTSVERGTFNSRPVFIDQDTETAGIQNTETTREVEEGDKGKSAGDAVLASDGDEPLLYSVGGPDKDYFAIDRKSAEITSAKDLDYESLPEDAKHYMVTVIATDPYGASASIAVTINVKDVNEPATITPAEQESASECTGSKPLKCTYDENGTNPVASFTASDEDTEELTFALQEVDDHGSFTIGADSGVLSFKKAPDFEAKSSYKVTVTTSAGGAHAVEISINNVEEGGEVTFEGNPQPQVERSLRANLKDGDGGEFNKVWQWSRSMDMEAWEDIETARASLYTPGSDDVGSYLRAAVTYRDALGSETETAMGMTDFKVESTPAANRRPEFPDQNLETAGIQNAHVVLEVKENTAKGTAVGEPVVAFDRDGDSLLYSLGDIPDSDAASPETYDGTAVADGTTTYTSAEDDGDVFTIDTTTGQIKVENKAALDFELATNEDDAYVVQVTATDPSGAPGTINVVITVEDVNEAPVIGDLTDDDGDATNGIDDGEPETNPEEISIAEESTAIDADPDTDDVQAATFTANDPDTAAADDTQSVDWSTAGPDGGKFKITTTGTAGRGVLTFDKAPSYEAKGSADGDNVYEVDVVAASDGSSSKHSVKITITNIEETGKIDRMSQLQPVTGIPIVALDHSDKDGDVRNRSWSWYRAPASDEDAIVVPSTGASPVGAGADSTLATLTDCDDDRVPPTADVDPCKVASGSASYTPVDNDAGYTLYAVVQYTDGHDDSDGDVAGDETQEYVVLASENASVVRATFNNRPVFIDQDTETAGIQNTETTREVEEGDKGKSAGDAVLASDGDEPLLYSVGGPDKDYFAIDRRTAEITSAKDLDYESLPEDAKHYMVTVIATDPYGASASIAVTINVKDVDEGAKIELSVPPEFASETAEFEIDENSPEGTDVGDPVLATDANGDDLTYSLDEMGDMYFDIDAVGQITVGEGAMLDYEETTSYTVTVTADDGTGFSATIAVTISVTDVNDAPTFDVGAGERMIEENMEVGSNVGDPVVATDQDGDELTYSISESMYFEIDPATGQITTTAVLDYEAIDSHEVTVTVSDVEATGEVAVTIGVIDVEESACVLGGAIASDASTGLDNDCLTLLEIRDDLVGEGTELNWSAETPMSEWDGVSSGTGRVVSIFLRTYGLAGVIPAAFNNLDALEKLQLHDNDLTGGIPDLSDLDNLIWLILQKNSLSGSLPTTLADMDSLDYLYLRDNDFSGEIPTELAGVMTLRRVDLRDNDLTGEIPGGFGDIARLRYLMLSENNLSGMIPAGLGNAANMNLLYLADNALTGEIPVELGNVTTLRRLQLHNNMLTGDVPAELGNLSDLRNLSLSGNMLTGCVPAAVYDALVDDAGLMACADDGS